jgi:hypothetical protein
VKQFSKGGVTMKVEKISYTPAEAALVTGLSVGTLGNMRSAKIGPKFYRIRKRKIIYLHDDLLSWLKSNPVQTIDSQNIDENR